MLLLHIHTQTHTHIYILYQFSSCYYYCCWGFIQTYSVSIICRFPLHQIEQALNLSDNGDAIKIVLQNSE